ncbi:hypothetical protein [Microtetraspora malaysiensis]|uniref:hypothetical protein n=1 Tax=Microtetraspora malaysiensis TaxID=161358 RepID=UPI00082E5818|nr:hypothetical protein [Microtetraspora malaysiensis]
MPGAAICHSAPAMLVAVEIASVAWRSVIPSRAGEILVRVVKHPNPPSHLILGAAAVRMAQDYSRSQLKEAAAWEPASRSADLGQDYPVDLVDHTREAGARQ